MRAEFSKRTKLEAFERQGGKCKCGSRLFPGNVEYHHDQACTYGGTADVANCVALCRACHRRVTGFQAREIAKSNRMRAKHLGLEGPPKRGGFRGWRKFNGTAVYADRDD